MAPGFVDDLAEFVLGVAVILDEPAIGLRFLDRVQVLALDILDQRDLERLFLAEVADDRRQLVQPRLLRRPPAPLAGDDLEAVAVRPHDDRLDDAPRLDRFGELGERVLVEDPPRLAGMRLDAGDRDHPHVAAPAGAAHRRLLRHVAEQRGEAAAEPRGALAGRFVAHAASALRGSRAISSRASAI
jgi:hypothetical protein